MPNSAKPHRKPIECKSIRIDLLIRLRRLTHASPILDITDKRVGRNGRNGLVKVLNLHGRQTNFNLSSAPYFGISNNLQRKHLIGGEMDASTKPKMESLKTSIKTAVKAPSFRK